MSQSEQINELASALSKAQGEMQSASKEGFNPHFKSHFADLASVWNAARAVLSKHGLCVMQTVETSADGTKSVLVTTLAHVSGQWIKSFFPLLLTKNDSQGLGSAITYGRRYSLSAIVGVVSDDDDDGEEACGRGKSQLSPQTKPQEVIEYIDEEQVMNLISLMSGLDVEGVKSFEAWIKKNYNSNVIRDLPKSAYEKCKASLTAKVKYINDKAKQ